VLNYFWQTLGGDLENVGLALLIKPFSLAVAASRGGPSDVCTFLSYLGCACLAAVKNAGLRHHPCFLNSFLFSSAPNPSVSPNSTMLHSLFPQSRRTSGVPPSQNIHQVAAPRGGGTPGFTRVGSPHVTPPLLKSQPTHCAQSSFSQNATAAASPPSPRDRFHMQTLLRRGNRQPVISQYFLARRILYRVQSIDIFRNDLWALPIHSAGQLEHCWYHISVRTENGIKRTALTSFTTK